MLVLQRKLFPWFQKTQKIFRGLVDVPVPWKFFIHLHGFTIGVSVDRLVGLTNLTNLLFIKSIHFRATLRISNLAVI